MIIFVDKMQMFAFQKRHQIAAAEARVARANVEKLALIIGQVRQKCQRAVIIVARIPALKRGIDVLPNWRCWALPKFRERQIRFFGLSRSVPKSSDRCLHSTFALSDLPNLIDSSWGIYGVVCTRCLVTSV